MSLLLVATGHFSTDMCKTISSIQLIRTCCPQLTPLEQMIGHAAACGQTVRGYWGSEKLLTAPHPRGIFAPKPLW